MNMAQMYLVQALIMDQIQDQLPNHQILNIVLSLNPLLPLHQNLSQSLNPNLKFKLLHQEINNLEVIQVLLKIVELLLIMGLQNIQTNTTSIILTIAVLHHLSLLLVLLGVNILPVNLHIIQLLNKKKQNNSQNLRDLKKNQSLRNLKKNQRLRNLKNNQNLMCQNKNLNKINLNLPNNKNRRTHQS